MTKQQVISVGVWIPGNADEYVDFKSDRSLLDADIIVFSPNLSSYSVEENYQGKATLNHTDSALLHEDIQHWKREITIALEAGKTVFLFMSGLDSVYIFTGEKQYSGTGRNARATNFVSLLDPYSAVPLANLVSSIQRRSGLRIKTTKRIGPLSSYWNEFGSHSPYQVYLDKTIGFAALVTQVGDKMVGGIVRFKDFPGAIVMLPPPSFVSAVKERAKQLREKKKRVKKISSADSKKLSDQAEISVGNQFISKLVEIDKTIRAGSDRTPTPDWARTSEYVLNEEARVQSDIAELKTKIEELQKQIEGANNNLEIAGNLRGLLFETGKSLESAVLEALRLMGFTAEHFADGQSEFDVIFKDTDDARFLGEVEGKNDKAVNIDKLSQLERNIQEDFEKRDDNTYAQGVLFGNAFRLVVPAERGDYFTEKCLAGAKRSGITLVRTPDLFGVAKYLKEHPNSSFASACRQAIRQAGGTQVVFPSMPELTVQ